MDWHSWHDEYADRASPLSRRLRIVQDHIAAFLDETARGPVSVVSACAGQGQDLLGVLLQRPPAERERVRAVLVEADARNVAVAQRAVTEARLQAVEVRRADAGHARAYRTVAPADLLLMCGVFGNISDADVERTVHALPGLCAAGATVIWTRSRRAPDRTPVIRQWFADAGFTERAFHAPDDVEFSVGVHKMTVGPQPLTRHGTLFRFIDR